MGRRLELQSLLEALLDSGNVYFQPPTNTVMVYPCIVYNRSGIPVDYADNHPYRLTTRYSVTVIDRDPDNVFVDLVAALPMCTFRQAFRANNLNHDVFDLHF